MKRHSVYGLLELILGVLLIVLGIWALAKPDFVLTGIVYAYAISAILMGIADLILYIEMERYININRRPCEILSVNVGLP